MRRPQVEPELAGVRDQERRVLAHVGDEPLREEVAASLPVGAGEQGLLVTDEERDRRGDQLGRGRTSSGGPVMPTTPMRSPSSSMGKVDAGPGALGVCVDLDGFAARQRRDRSGVRLPHSPQIAARDDVAVGVHEVEAVGNVAHGGVHDGLRDLPGERPRARIMTPPSGPQQKGRAAPATAGQAGRAGLR